MRTKWMKWEPRKWFQTIAVFCQSLKQSKPQVEEILQAAIKVSKTRTTTLWIRSSFKCLQGRSLIPKTSKSVPLRHSLLTDRKNQEFLRTNHRMLHLVNNQCRHHSFSRRQIAQHRIKANSQALLTVVHLTISIRIMHLPRSMRFLGLLLWLS